MHSKETKDILIDKNLITQNPWKKCTEEDHDQILKNRLIKKLTALL